MKNWNIFLSCAYLRCKWWATRPLELCLLLLLVPLLMFIITSVTNSVLSHDGLPLAIVDEDHSEYSELIIQRLSKQSLISIQMVDREEAIQLVHTNKVEAVIFFNEGFMESILNEKRSEIIELVYPPSSFTERIVSELVAIEVLRLSSNVRATQFINRRYEDFGLINSKLEQQHLWNEAWNHSDSYWEPKPLMSINYVETNNVDGNVETKDLTLVYYHLHLLIGYLSVLILISSIFVQQWLVEEKDLGVVKRLKSTPVSPFIYVIGHSLPGFVFVVLQGMFALVVIYANHRFLVPLTFEVILLFVTYLFTVFTASALIGILVKTNLQLQGIGILIAVLTSFIGGSFIDLGDWIQTARWLSFFTPQGWFLTSMKEIIPRSINQPPLYLVLPGFISLVGFSMFFSLLCIGGWKKL